MCSYVTLLLNKLHWLPIAYHISLNSTEADCYKSSYLDSAYFSKPTSCFSKKEKKNPLIHTKFKKKFPPSLILDLKFYLLFSSLGWASLVVQMVKNLHAKQETCIWSLNGEDALEKGMATSFSILAWKIPWTEGTGGQQSMGLQSQIWLND